MRWLAIALVLASCRDAPAPPPVKPAPTITRVIPAEVAEHGYRLGQIEGEGFDTKRAVKVWFGENQALRAAVVAKTKIQVEIPPGKDGSEVDVRVEIEGYAPAISPTKVRYISAAHGEHEGSAEHGSADHGH